MALQRVAELVRRAAADTGVLSTLEDDPDRLTAMLGLTRAHLEALHSASAFPVGKKAAATPKVAALAQLQSLALEAGAPFPGSGGTLFPPEGSGEAPEITAATPPLVPGTKAPTVPPKAPSPAPAKASPPTQPPPSQFPPSKASPADPPKQSVPPPSPVIAPPV